LAEILLHTEKIPEEIVSRLAQEGVIAVRVKDLTAFKFVQPTTASIHCNDFVWALLDALDKETGSFGNGVREKALANLATLAREERERRLKQL
jgi:hypothetical protein